MSGAGFDAGTYDLSESGGALGYSAGTWSCTAGQTGTEAKVTVGLGANITCTITNDDIPGTLLVTKVVRNFAGLGVVSANQFEIIVNGTDVAEISDPPGPGTQAVREFQMDAGAYSVSENGPGVFSTTFEGDCNSSIGLGETKECLITNTMVPQSVVTSSSLCTFDRNADRSGSQFRLIYTPDVTTQSVWKLNASNPGQFYYNIFTSETESKTLTVTLPYPFVTQGARPVHVYSSVSTSEVDGQTCLTPGTETGSDGAQIGLASYPAQSLSSTAAITVQVPAGFSYVAIHLDYGLKGTTNISRDGANGAVLSTPALVIPDFQQYSFEFADGVTVVPAIVESENAFKKIAGFAGIVSDALVTGVPNVQVTIIDPSGSVVGTAATDVDGYYLHPYKHTGKTATYTVRLPAHGLAQQVPVKANAFVYVPFTVGSSP